MQRTRLGHVVLGIKVKGLHWQGPCVLRIEHHRASCSHFWGYKCVGCGGIPITHPDSISFFLHLLTQDSSKVREELPLLVHVSCSGNPNGGIYSNLSQVNSVDVSEEDQPKCPEV